MLKLFRPRPPAAASLPAGRRLYAVGDVHGRLDLLDALLAAIDADDAARPAADTALVFLGDVIDRGPASAAVVERLRRLGQERPGTRFLLGNHEEMFLSALSGDRRALQGFCRMGGRETILSYGVDPAAYERMDYDEVAQAMAAIVPPEHRAFLAGFEDVVVVGDYAFVHAGIDPRVPLDAQKPASLRWMREPFLDHRGALEKMIVHGHTIGKDVTWRANRIGIDTGAYASGRLTALGLDGTDRWTLQT